MPFLLPAFAAAQALGILLADRFEPSHVACWLAAGVLASGALAFRPESARKILLLGAALAGGAASLARPLELADATAFPGEATIEATADRVRRLGDRVRVDWKEAVAIAGAEVPPRLRLFGRLDARVPAALQDPLPGERWRLRVRLARPAGPRNPGMADGSRRLARRGIAATGSRLHPGLAVRVGFAGEGAARRLTLWRRRMAERLVRAGPGGGLLAALGLGDRTGLSQRDRDDFARLGLAHLLAVSGLHLSLAAGSSFWLTRSALARIPGFAARHDARRAAVGIALPAACLYAAVSGFGIPVQRALVLLGVAALALSLRRPRRRAAPLAAAAIVLLARSPHDLFEPGFQLSFAATAGLLMSGLTHAGGGRAGPVQRAWRGVLRLLGTSSAALLATAPLVAWHFGQGAPIGLLANLVAVPATAAVLMPAAAAALVGASLDGGFADMVLSGSAGIASRCLLAVRVVAEAIPEAWVVGLPPVSLSVWVLIVAGLIAVVSLRSGDLRIRLLALALQAAVFSLAPLPEVSPEPARVAVLDVGQGDAILVQGRRGVLLVDAGPRLPSGSDAGARIVRPALRALGVRRIDRLAVSHADLDHRGGAPAILEAFAVGAVWLPPGGLRDAAFSDLVDLARRRGVPVLERAAGDAAESVGDLSVEFLWPPRGRRGMSRNDGSLVLRVAAAGGSVLLPGDVGESAEQALVDRGIGLVSDLLVLPHHGSRTSGSAAFLTAVRPRRALVSAPCRGRFAMPHPDVRRRIADRGVPLAWTGREGALIVGLTPRLPLRSWGTPRRGCFESARSARRGRKLPSLPVFPRETR